MNSVSTYEPLFNELPNIIFKIMASECSDEISDIGTLVDENLIKEAGERIRTFSSICIDNMVEFFINTGKEQIKATAEIDKKYYPGEDAKFIRWTLTPRKSSAE